jgi:hypothetical protein
MLKHVAGKMLILNSLRTYITVYQAPTLLLESFSDLADGLHLCNCVNDLLRNQTVSIQYKVNACSSDGSKTTIIHVVMTINCVGTKVCLFFYLTVFLRSGVQ